MDTYEKKFIDFLDKMQGLLDNAKKQGHIIVRVEDLENALSEFVESEDENIRKELIEHIKANCESDFILFQKFSPDDILDWLKKQGEQKPTLPKWKYKKGNTPLLRDSIILNKYGGIAKSPSGAIVSDVWVLDYDELAKLPKEEIENQGEQKPTGMVEPNFKVGDWVVYNRNDSSMEILYIYDIRDGRYYFNDNIHFSWSVKECDEKCHLWTIQDAKDGDVLVHNSITFIFKGIEDGIVKGLCSELSDSILNFGESEYDNDYYPATKEQRDTLFAAMKTKGYELDADKKELQKSKWTEEDEKNWLGIMYEIEANKSNASDYDIEVYDRFLSWLESLKQRIKQ